MIKQIKEDAEILKWKAERAEKLLGNVEIKGYIFNKVTKTLIIHTSKGRAIFTGKIPK